MRNHLGNVLTVVTDRKIAVDSDNNGIVDYFSADIVSSTDYYSFGSPMPSRSFSASSYRYGFNGKELDPEGMGGGGSTYDYGFRIYNPNLGKFLSVDPLTKNYAMLTPYQFSSNSPIECIDLDGLEAVKVGKNNPFLVIVALGRAATFSDEIINGNTLYKNLPTKDQNDDGLALIKSYWDDFNPTIIVYTGSSDDKTSDDIAQTIKDYRVTNPEGKIVLVGHSLGGKNVIDASLKVASDGEIKNKVIEAVITLEPASNYNNYAAPPYSATLEENVKNSIVYNSNSSNSKGDGGVIKNETNQKYGKFELRPGTDHRNLDNSLLYVIDALINLINSGYNPVDAAKNVDYKNLKTYDNGDISNP